MAKVTKAFNAFTAGELSPRLFGRTDLSKYDSGASTVENYLVQAHGGLARRPGTRFISEVKTSTDKTRLVLFQFNTEQAYILEFGNNYFRIYKDDGQITSSGSPVEVTTTYASSQISALQFAQSADVMYVTSPNHQLRKISRTSHTAWTISDVDLKRGPMLDQNITDTTITASALTGSINLTASADLWVTTDVGRLVGIHEGFAKITSRTSATVAVATVQELEDGRTELLPSYTATTISFHEGDPDSSGLEHNDRLEDTAADFIEQGFNSGQTITISGSTSNNTTAGFLIVAVTDSTMTLAPGADLTDEAAGDTVTLAGKLEATDKWSLGAFSDTTGYPRACAFYEQRLVLAGTSNEPQTIYFSQGSDFENFESGAEADDGLVYTIGSNEVNVIEWMSSTRQLIVGTSGGEFVVRASGNDEPISPTNVQIKKQTAYGATDIHPLQVGNTVLFVQRAKRKIRELLFNFDSDGYVAPDLTLLSEHVTESGIVDFAYQGEPDTVVWAVRTDGQMTTLTYLREEKVTAWTRHILGGQFDGGSAVVESVATVPGTLDEDEVWVLVKRDIAAQATCTLTVTDFSNIATNSTITLTAHDGTSETFTCQGSGTGTPDAGKFFHNSSNNVTADNIFNCINAASSRFSAANPAANVITITRAVAGNDNLVTTTSDATRLTIINFTGGRATKRYVEQIKTFDLPTDLSDAVFVDSCLTFTGEATTLNGSHAADATSIVLIDASSFSSSGTIKINNEFITYSGKSSNTLTGATRGSSGVAAAHSNGATVTQAATTLSGLNHLEGETVDILADGAAHASKTVASGAITLDRNVIKAQVGLPYTSTLKTLRVDAGSEMGASQGKIKRIDSAVIRLHETVGLKVGKSLTSLDVVPFRSSSDAMNTAIPLFSGDKEVEFSEGFDTDAFIFVQQAQPLPQTILSIFATLQTFDT